MDLDAVIFNSISSNILNWSRFKVVSWRHDIQPYTTMFWDWLIFGLLLGLFDCWVIIGIV
jgi:hypothetical protein